MNRRTALGQCLGAFVALGLLVVLGDRALCFLVVGLCGLCLLGLSILAGVHRFRAGRILQPDRQLGDLQIPVAVAIGLGLPGLLAGLGALTTRLVGWGTLEEWQIPDTLTGALAVAGWVLVPSSLIDWYWIRPRRDGVYPGLSPCQITRAGLTDAQIEAAESEHLERRVGLTRWVLVHRMVAALIYAAAGSMTFYALLRLGSTWPPHDSFASEFFGAVAAPLSALTFVMSPWLSGVKFFLPRFLSSVPFRLGDVLKVDSGEDDFVGLIWEVSLEGLTLVGPTPDVASSTRGATTPSANSPYSGRRERKFVPVTDPSIRHVARISTPWLCQPTACNRLDDPDRAQCARRSLPPPALRRLPTLRELAAICCIAAGIALVVAFYLLTRWQTSWLRTIGWSPLRRTDTEWPSLLALGDGGWLLGVLFVTAGLATTVYSVLRLFRPANGQFERIVAGLVCALGLALALIAFPADLPTRPGRSWHAWIHNSAYDALVVLALAALAFMLFRAPAGRRRLASIVHLTLTLALLVALISPFTASVAQLLRYPFLLSVGLVVARYACECLPEWLGGRAT